MENTQNLSNEVIQRNHGFGKSCSNCFVTITHCPCDQAPCWCCHDHSEWQSVPDLFYSHTLVEDMFFPMDYPASIPLCELICTYMEDLL